MIKTICTCLSLQSVFLYQLQPHSQREYTIAMYRIVPTIVYEAYNNVHVYSFRFIVGLNDGHTHSQLLIPV